MTTATTSEADTDAETRMVRVILAVLALTTLGFGLLNVDRITVEHGYLNPIWHLISLSVVFGLPPVLAVLAPVLALAAIRGTLGLYAVLYLLVVASWLPAMGGGAMPVDYSPWAVTVTGLATSAAALAWGMVAAWAYFAVATLAIVPIRFFAAGAIDLTPALQDSFFWATLGAIFTALILATRHNARMLDLAATTARITTARTAALLAREREQSRLDALVHDEVISTLHYASLGGPELADSVRRQAVRALAELARLRTPLDSQPAEVDICEFIGAVRSVVLGSSSGLEFSVVGRRDAPVPAAVSAAFSEAAAEAVRNSILHADVPGRATTRSATLVLGPGGIALRIDDDGAGFESRDVSGLRLGIAVSIRGRFSTLPGGSADVISQRDGGTTVALEWLQE